MPAVACQMAACGFMNIAGSRGWAQHSVCYSTLRLNCCCLLAHDLHVACLSGLCLAVVRAWTLLACSKDIA